MPTPSVDDSPAGASGSHNQSVLRAVAVLRCFADGARGQTLSELARRTGISVSSTHRILQTLVAGGVLRRDERSDRYVPGIVLLALAGSTYAAAGYGPLLQVLTDVVARTGESASLAVRDGDCAVVLLAVESPQQLRFGHVPGTRVPLHGSPLGLALLAASRRPAADEVRDLVPLAPFESGAVTPDELAERVEEVRGAGHASGAELPWPGAWTVAVPVPASVHRAGPVAIGVHGPASRLDDDRVREVTALLEEVAIQLATVPVDDPAAP